MRVGTEFPERDIGGLGDDFMTWKKGYKIEIRVLTSDYCMRKNWFVYLQKKGKKILKGISL